MVEAHVSRFNYDVFLSFRGFDTGSGFTKHLYDALTDKYNIKVFMYGGYQSEKIDDALLKVIEGSKIAIIVFSESYACSTWCLDELLMILDCKKRKGLLVIPVFYKVEPKAIMKQWNSYGQVMAFKKCEDGVKKIDRWKSALFDAVGIYISDGSIGKVNRWGLALSQAVALQGWDTNSRDEEELIKCLVEEVTGKLNSQILYDVFISFRGYDTRYGFTGNLYNALRKAKIKTFMDEEGLRMGDQISKVFQAIEQSRMSILVFSETYASSEWCLNELVKILDCMDSKGQMVLPVFYKVTPSMVRNQTGSYGACLADHEITYADQMHKVNEWRSALKKASYIIGRELKEGGYEYKLIEELTAIVSERKK